MATTIDRTSGVPSWALRWMVNLALFLATTLMWSLFSFLFADDGSSAWLIGYGWLVVAIYLGPGTLAYLAGLELLPVRWTSWSRRLVAVIATPVVVFPFWFIEGFPIPFMETWRFALLAAFGLLVRLRAATPTA